MFKGLQKARGKLFWSLGVDILIYLSESIVRDIYNDEKMGEHFKIDVELNRFEKLRCLLKKKNLF